MYSVQTVSYGSQCSSYVQTRTCTNGILSGSTSYQYPSCTQPAPHCLVNGIPVAEGTIRTYYSRPNVGIGQSCNSYSEVRTCANGVMTGSSNFTYPSCSTTTPDSCSVGGITISHGSSRTFYSQASATSTSCSSYGQTRSCNNGVLSGDSQYSQSSCSAGVCQIDGITLTSGSTTTFYLAGRVPSGEQCTSYAQSRQCSSGTLSGDAAYKYSSCSPVSAGTCVVDSTVVANGASSVFYSAAVAPAGQTCSSISTTRTCSNGAFGGGSSYNRATCTDTQECSLNGVTVGHGSAKSFYSASTVAFGTTCGSISQSRTCTNGQLSGNSSYQYGSCSVNPPTAQSAQAQLAAALTALEGALQTLLAWFNR